MSIDTLKRRLDRMLEQLEPRILPKEWEIIAEAGQELPAHILAQIGIYDSILIREIPPGYFGDDMSFPKVAWYKSGERYFVPGRDSDQAA